MAAPNNSSQAAAAAAADASVAARSPGAAPDDDDLTRALAKVTLATPVAVPTSDDNVDQSDVSPPLDLARISRARKGIPTAKKPTPGRRLLRVPTDYLRAGQESRDRRRRRALVRKGLRTLFSVFEGRARDRRLSHMLLRLSMRAAGSGDGDDAADTASASTTAATSSSSSERDGLADMLDKMALSTKD